MAVPPQLWSAALEKAVEGKVQKGQLWGWGRGRPRVALRAVKVCRGDRIKPGREFGDICLMQPIERTLVILERVRQAEPASEQQIEPGLPASLPIRLGPASPSPQASPSPASIGSSGAAGTPAAPRLEERKETKESLPSGGGGGKPLLGAPLARNA